jgi:hypothetical protein
MVDGGAIGDSQMNERWLFVKMPPQNVATNPLCHSLLRPVILFIMILRRNIQIFLLTFLDQQTQ